MKKVIGLFCVVGLAACGGGSGSVDFTTYGEEYIEQKIPVDSADATGFVDGWELSYSKFLVVIGEIKVASKDGTVGATMKTPKVFNLKKKGPLSIEKFDAIAASRWDRVSYALAPASAAVAGSADQADVDFMKTNGYSTYIEASVTKGAVTKTLKWGFTTNTLYEVCESKELGQGVVVPTGGTETVQLTVHGDHFWYDDLQSEKAKIRFQAYADADKTPADGEVTLDEVNAVQLTSLPVTQYGVGGASNVKTLKDFVTSVGRTIGHFRGEGECAPKVR